MLILYGDNNFSLQTPSFSTIESSDFFQNTTTYTFNTCDISVWRRIENFVRMRNQTGIKTEASNIAGKTIGDYTCEVLDTSTNRRFYAKIELSTSMSKDTMFFDRLSWNNTGRTFSMNVREVEI